MVEYYISIKEVIFMATKFGVIHEQGDYCEFEELSDKDNEIVKEQYQRKEEQEKQQQKYRG